MPRRHSLPVTLPDGTAVVITENRLSCAKLSDALDDDLTPSDWLKMLNNRVFFWPSPHFGEQHLNSRLKLGFACEWQVYDTLRLLRPVWARAEIAPINTGSTLRKPARRGLATFAPLDGLDYPAWRKSRGNASPDMIKEVTVRGSLAHAGTALLSTEPAAPTGCRIL